MTTMTAAATDYDDAGVAYGVCWRCGGPCLTHKGSVHGWTCTACINDYLDAGAAKADARDRKERERLLAKRHNDIRTASTGQRQEGGVSVMYRPASGADQERAADRSYVPRRSE